MEHTITRIIASETGTSEAAISMLHRADAICCCTLQVGMQEQAGKLRSLLSMPLWISNFAVLHHDCSSRHRTASLPAAWRTKGTVLPELPACFQVPWQSNAIWSQTEEEGAGTVKPGFCLVDN